MKNKRFYISGILILSSFLQSDMVTYKSSLKNNGSTEYRNTPLYAENINDIFRKGVYISHIKSNYFTYINQEGDKNDIYAVGVDLKYRTAKFKDMYLTGQTSLVFNPLKYAYPNNINKAYKGIDLFSKKNYILNKKRMVAIPELNITYKPNNNFNIIYGYQGYNNNFVAENNTKMIKNTFNGISMQFKNKNYNYKSAIFISEKLRNHEMYGDIIKYNSSIGNDDGANHKGLTYENGLRFNTQLILNQFDTYTIPRTKISISNATILKLFNSSMVDIENYIPFNGFNIIIGGRYYKQIDRGAGKIGGPSLSGIKNKGKYTDNTVNNDMYGGKIKLKLKNNEYLFGYTKVNNGGDLISPWRGFPTKGYTRSMGINNWYSNTISYMFQMKSVLDKYGIVVADYSVISSDKNKIDNNGNFLKKYNVYHIDYTINNFSSIKNLQVKTRYSFINFGNKNEQDIRTEINFLF